MPALGIALLMGIVIKNKTHLIFFMAGFVLLSFAKLSMIAIVFIAALVAYMYYFASSNKGTGNGESETKEATESAVNTDDEYEDDDLF